MTHDLSNLILLLFVIEHALFSNSVALSDTKDNFCSLQIDLKLSTENDINISKTLIFRR